MPTKGSMKDFMRNGRGSAVKWFALAAYRAPPPTPASRVAADAGIDPMPTGSVPSSALLIRIR